MSSYKEQREKYLSKVLAPHRAGVTKGEMSLLSGLIFPKWQEGIIGLFI